MLDDGRQERSNNEPSENEFERLSLRSEKRARSSHSSSLIPKELTDLAIAVEQRREEAFEPLVPLLLVQTIYDRESFIANFSPRSFGMQEIFTHQIVDIYDRGKLFEHEKSEVNALASYLLEPAIFERLHLACGHLNKARGVMKRAELENLIDFGDIFFTLDFNIIEPMKYDFNVEAVNKAHGYLHRISNNLKKPLYERTRLTKSDEDRKKDELLHNASELLELTTRECDRVTEQLKHVLSGRSIRGQVVTTNKDKLVFEKLLKTQ